ncbi:MAG TPA: sigma-70 family RNA polymerase sigma factor [Myxococcota bacterium]|nr:sigma-70 family RNA polymerase sigma factor [Myxococcota bacterium]
MDRDDIARLYRELGPLVHRRCLRLLRHPENARDATQEVFVRALRHAPELMWDRGCLPWLYRVATNLCLNRLRDRRPEDSEGLERLAAAGAGAGGAGPAAEDWLSARRAVLGLLGQLDDDAAQIAVHAWMDEMTQEEIAGVMGLSRKTIGKKLARVEELARRWREAQGGGEA